MPRPDQLQHFRKEFIMEMQAKGKIPRFVTEASDRHDQAYHVTTDRIFPGPGGIDTVLTNMLKATAKRIDGAQEGGTGAKREINSKATDEAVAKALERADRRKELKARMVALESAVSSERSARIAAEETLSNYKTSSEASCRS